MGHIWIVVNNVSTDTAKPVTAWPEAHSRMTTLYLPKYASHINPIERIWREVKDKLVANYYYPTLARCAKPCSAIWTASRRPLPFKQPA